LIGLDTNILVRYLAQDDARQSALATRYIEQGLSPENPGFVSAITLCEIAWVLADRYAADRGRIRRVVEGLLATRQIQVEQPDLVRRALRVWEGAAADFSDALIGQIAAAHGCEKTLTFDRAAAKLPGFELLA
jgi:predicted nucleic-acid-binding protein